jgi:hypothetical protein
LRASGTTNKRVVHVLQHFLVESEINSHAPQLVVLIFQLFQAAAQVRCHCRCEGQGEAAKLFDASLKK